jgi:hypothetical protein
MLPAEEAWNVYRLQWEVGTFFKTAKSGWALAELLPSRHHRVKALVLAALIRATIAIKAKGRLILLASSRSGICLIPQQWMRWWNRHLHPLLHRLVVSEVPFTLGPLFLILSDPNGSRIPSWVALA